MDVSPQLLREVDFSEKWRGYNPDEVDDFLERLAIALDQLQKQLADAVDRANRAERRVLEESGGEDELRRTLVLAQRTADAALDEARETAATLMSQAEADAEEIRRAGDERAAAAISEAEARVASELAPLLAQRDALEGDVEALRTWSTEIRARMVAELRQQLSWLEGSEGDLPDPPDVVDIELPEQHDGAAQMAEDDTVGDDRGDATGVFDALADPDDDGRYGEEDGALATAAADDPFLAELRRAVTDDEPLGPREHTVYGTGDGDDEGEDSDADVSSSSVFRRRKRR